MFLLAVPVGDIHLLVMVVLAVAVQVGFVLVQGYP
jgi:hypothetical protein